MKSSWRQILLAFLLGILTATLVFSRCPIGAGEFRKSPEKMFDRFSKELRLTPDQKTRVKKILDDKRVRLQAVRDEQRPRFDAVRQQTRSEIEAVLTPEQVETFRRLEARRDQMRQKRRGGWER